MHCPSSSGWFGGARLQSGGMKAAAGTQPASRMLDATPPRQSQQQWKAVMLRAVALLFLATIASPGSSAASIFPTFPARARSLAQPWRSTLSHVVGTVEDGFSASDSGAERLGTARRRLLHPGGSQTWQLPRCSQCEWLGCTASGEFRVGHCRRHGERKHCWQWKNAGGRAAAPQTSPPGGKSTMKSAEPARTGPLDAVFEQAVGSDTLIVRGIACFSDADCALPPARFAAINGSAPASSNGALSASCVRGAAGDDGKFSKGEPGVCLCAYGGPQTTLATDNSTATASGTASAAAGVTMNRRRGVGSTRALLQGGGFPFQRRNFTREDRDSPISATAQISIRSPVFVDLCVQIPNSARDKGRLSNDSLGVLVPAGQTNRSTAGPGANITLGLPVGDVNLTDGDVGPGFLLPDDFAQSVYGTYEYLYAYD
eukprot:jgi/Ulvmu1/5731/UM244_0002.1